MGDLNSIPVDETFEWPGILLEGMHAYLGALSDCNSLRPRAIIRMGTNRSSTLYAGIDSNSFGSLRWIK